MAYDFCTPPKTPQDLERFCTLARKDMRLHWCPNCYHWAVVYRVSTDTLACKACGDRDAVLRI